MKKILMVVTVLMTLILVTGCGSNRKDKLTSEEFYDKINSEYKLTDITSRLDFVQKAYAYEKDGVLIYFYEGNRTFDMGNIYIDEVQNVSGQMMDKKDSIDKGDNYSSITIYNDEEYYRIAYVDNTLLYAKGPKANQYIVDDVFKKAGY